MSDFHNAAWRTRRLIDFVIVLVVGGPLLFANLTLFEWLQRSQCPRGTFLVGTLRPGAEMIALIAASLGATYLLQMSLIDRWTWLRERWRPYDPDKKTPKWAFRIAGAACAISIPLFVWAALCQYCAAPVGLSFRVEPWAQARSYGWDHIEGIATTCSPGARGSWNTGYFVVMAGGAAVNLMNSPKNFARAYSGLVGALHGRAFAFDDHRVRAGCGSPYLRFLVNRP